MSYASIMVHMDREPGAARRAKLAAGLADLFDANLIGVAARRPSLNDTDLDDDVVLNLAQEQIDHVERVFQKAAGQRNAIKFRSDHDEPTSFVAEQSRLADLIVVGRQAHTDPHDGRFGIDVGELLLSAGRPLLIVAPHMSRLDPSRVLVAWKNTREARRAVRDALPFLKSAAEVFVTTVEEDNRSDGADDVVDHLCRHGVAARTTRIILPEKSVAGEIVDVARGINADLIVAGGYGYSRLREWFFGGVTRDLLAMTPVCCLMSH